MGRAQQTVPGGASAVVELEGPVGVAPAARLPVDAPWATRPVGERHAARQLGPDPRENRVGATTFFPRFALKNIFFFPRRLARKKRQSQGRVRASVRARPLPAAPGPAAALARAGTGVGGREGEGPGTRSHCGPLSPQNSEEQNGVR